MSRLVFGFMYLIHFLPLSFTAKIGNALGMLLFWLIHERRKVIRINLERCFPKLDRAQRERLARAHFRLFARSLLERSILWWAPRERIERMVRIDGLENLTKASGPVILLAPHFLGFDASISRLSLEFQMAGMYARQKDPVADRLLYRGRGRFGARLMERKAGLKAAVGAIKSGAFYFYLPDLDYGPKHSIFVPFFGVQAATVTGLSYLARASGAAIVPCVTRMLPGGDGYVTTIYPAWSDFPGRATSAGRYADARRMLAFIEERVLEMPEQYYWLHKRFKTRPPGEPRFYP